MRHFYIIMSLLLCGCTASPLSPTHQVPNLSPYYSETTGAIPQAQDVHWWSAFRDPGLDSVIDYGMSNNLDIRTALLRIDAADQNMVVAGSGGLPSISFDMSSIRSRETGPMRQISGVVDTSFQGASASWLIDVFGEVRSQVLSAKAGRNAAVEAVSIARLALLTDIASAYVDARYYQELSAAGARAVASRQKGLALTRKLAEQGVASELDVSRSVSAVEMIRGKLPDFDADFRRSAHRISTLMGLSASTPVSALQIVRGQPLPAFDPDAGFPADLVRNRPDIRKAEQELVAAVADIGYARSQLFPSITLTGKISSSYISTDAASGDLNKWSFGPTLRLPIFEGGKLRANVKIAASQAAQKELAWRGVVLKAVEEVENALVAYNRSRIAVRSLQTRVNAIQKTMRLSNAAYEAGMDSRLEALEAERDLFEAETDLALERRNLALNFINVNIAVGRGLPGPGGAAFADNSACSAPDCVDMTGSIPKK